MRMRTIKDLLKANKRDRAKALTQVQVIPRIETYLEDKNLEGNDRALECFSASDLGSKGGLSLCGNYPMGCARMLYYRYIGEEPREQIDPRLRRIFDTGTAVHLQLQQYLRDIAERTGGTEVFTDEAGFDPSTSRVADEYEIISTTDGIWEITIKGKMDIRFGIEIKTMKSDLFKQLSAASVENVVQSIVYMACLDLPVMSIVYYNKDDSSMAEFQVPFNEKIWKAVTDKINYVRVCAVEEKPPTREIGYHCRNCRYAWVCKPPKPERKSIRLSRKKFHLRGGA